MLHSGANNPYHLSTNIRAVRSRDEEFSSQSTVPCNITDHLDILIPILGIAGSLQGFPEGKKEAEEKEEEDATRRVRVERAEMLNYPMACEWIGERRPRGGSRRDESSGVEGEGEEGASEIKKKRRVKDGRGGGGGGAAKSARGVFIE